MAMIPLRILFGVLKGALIGGLLGGVLWFLETGGDLGDNEASWSRLRWPLYGVIGLFTGIVAGRPPWARDSVRGAAWVSSIFKGIVGFGVCVGLYFLANWLLSFDLFGRVPTKWYFAFGAAVGVIYAVFIEVDDSIGRKDEDSESKKKPAAPDGGGKSDAIVPKSE